MADKPKRRRTQFSLDDELAAVMKETYVAMMRIFSGDRGGKKSDEVFDPDDRYAEAWLKLSSFIRKNEIWNYLAFLQVQFESRTGRAHCPTPMQCYGPVALQRWHEHVSSMPSMESQIEQSLLFQQSHVRLEHAKTSDMAQFADEPWTEREVDFYVLTNSNNQLDPLFRYCKARELGLDEVAEAYHRSALLQYLIAKNAYDEVWGSVIPETVKEEAAHLCRRRV